MIATTTGIILHSFKYGETSIIARIYSSDLGLQSYLVPGVRKSKARIRQNLFQPLTIVNMVVYHKEKGGLQRIKEISCPTPFSTIPYNISKSSIALFLAEMLTHSIKSHESNPALFAYIHNAIRQLDLTDGRVADFHLVFLLQLTRFLGFQPRDNYDSLHCYFNLREGTFQREPGHREECLDQNLSQCFFRAANTGLHEADQLLIPKEQRKTLLDKTIDYYRFHLEGLGEVKSHHILEMVLHEKV